MKTVMISICLPIILVNVATGSILKYDQAFLDDLAIKNFREYLRIPSVHPDVNYDDCVTFLKKQAESLKLPVAVNIFGSSEGKPTVVITWVGTEPEKPSIMLNSHMDVVPVEPESWTYPPFSAHVDEKGDIYGRGAQDMKSLGIIYLEAIRRLILDGMKPKRTVIVTFVPDEEIGGKLGMKLFVQSSYFKSLNVGFVLDEGLTSEDNSTIYIYNNERVSWEVEVLLTGNAGHGSLLLNNTAAEKFRAVIDNFSSLRKRYEDEWDKSIQSLGKLVSINLTLVKGGIQNNVIPGKITATYDVRLPPDFDENLLLKLFDQWSKEAGEGVHFNVTGRQKSGGSTRVDDSNIFWSPLRKAVTDSGYKLECNSLPATTDMRFIRKLGIPALGFTPLLNTHLLIHDHNEKVNKKEFLNGIQIYMKIISAVANV